MGDATVRIREDTARSVRSFRVSEDGRCFVCGNDNPIGLKLQFQMVDGRVETTFIPQSEHQGFVGIVHGGLIGMVLDEAMAKLLYLQGIEALTCEITVRLHRVARVKEPLTIKAHLLAVRKRVFDLEAWAAKQNGEWVASASAKFLLVGGDGSE